MSFKPETKKCQNCKGDFTIEPDDFSFYEKIKVPAPTWCPRCRLFRRMMQTNERVLYKRKCDLTGEDIFSMYDEDTPFPVYKMEHWYSDDWDPAGYAMEIDWSRPFLEQFLELRNKVPQMALVAQGNIVNSPYTHRVHDMKNSYMVFRTTKSEDSSYVYMANDVKNCVDCFGLTYCELCYECVDVEKCYRLCFSQDCAECVDSFFLFSCRNCTNCVGCVNLNNKEYCIFNKQYSKEEYEKKLKEIKLNTFSGIEKFKKEFAEFKKKYPKRFMTSLKTDNVSGNWLSNCKNVLDSYRCNNVKDGRYLFSLWDAEDCMDYFQWGNHAERIYESLNCGIDIQNLYFCNHCWMGANNLAYCESCPGASNCFGCVGLKKGEYSILNKKYSKEEYQKLLPKIIQHMKDMPYKDANGLVYSYGENLPIEFSPFAYNESAAYDFFPVDKDEATRLGLKWKEKDKKDYKTTIKSSDLPETISEVDDSILREVIECGEKDKSYSVGAYRISQNELSFYRQMDLPLPRVCYDVRHYDRLSIRPSMDLLDRECNKCGVQLRTNYTEKNFPIIYCEKCYQNEVY